jgi:predicted ATPase
MITHVSLTDFRCFRKVEVELKPLTVLIGQNDTGKSSFLWALRRLASGSIPREDFWRGTGTAMVMVQTEKGPIQRGPTALGNHSILNPTELFALPAQGVNMVSGGEPGVPMIRGDGANVPALVDYLLREDRKRFDAFVEAMRQHVPGLEDIHVTTPDAARRSLDLVVDGGYKFQAQQASAGVRLLIFFLALAYHPTPPKLALIEEPENGLHPRRMGEVVRLLRGLTTGALGQQRVQVVLTTHSPLLLDEIDLAKDQVLVFRRNKDGGRTVEAADHERLKTFLDEFKLGEVWFNREEQGLIKKAGAS